MRARVTPGDLRALSAYLDGGSTKVAAERLGIAPATFRARLTRVHARLGVESTAGAIWELRHELKAYRDGREDGPQGAWDATRPGPRALSGAGPRV